MDKISGSSTNFFYKIDDFVNILFLSSLAYLLCRVIIMMAENVLSTFCTMKRNVLSKFWTMMENATSISLTITHVGQGKDLCAVCKKKATASMGFTEHHDLEFKEIYKEAFTNIKFFNSFGKEESGERFKVEYVDGTQCFTIHDCGCLQNITYELASLRPMRLVCQPSSDYKNVLVEGNMEGVLDPAEFTFIEQSEAIADSKMPEVVSFFFSLGNQILEALSCVRGVTLKLHCTKGNITFGENSYVNPGSKLEKETAK